MKKILSIILILSLVFMVTACKTSQVKTKEGAMTGIKTSEGMDAGIDTKTGMTCRPQGRYDQGC